MFDVSESVIGKTVNGVQVYAMDSLESKLEEFGVNIAILTLPKEFATDVATRLGDTNISGIWNFTGKEIALDPERVVVENVHIGDSLMTLCYEVAQNMYHTDKKG